MNGHIIKEYKRGIVLRFPECRRWLVIDIGGKRLTGALEEIIRGKIQKHLTHLVITGLLPFVSITPELISRLRGRCYDCKDFTVTTYPWGEIMCTDIEFNNSHICGEPSGHFIYD